MQNFKKFSQKKILFFNATIEDKESIFS